MLGLLKVQGLAGLLDSLDGNYVRLAKTLCKLHGSLDVAYDGYTLLQLACHNGDADDVRMLLGLGASVDYYPLADSSGHYIYEVTPLAIAARANQLQVVLVLLEAGADVRGDSGAIALSLALLKQNQQGDDTSEVVKLLREWGAV
jgi:ankyrin repeat protein